MSDEYRIGLVLSVNSTRRILYKFKQDEERDGLDVLLDRIDSLTDREDASMNDCSGLMVSLALLRRAMIDSINGEIVSRVEIDRPKAGIKSALGLC